MRLFKSKEAILEEEEDIPLQGHLNDITFIKIATIIVVAIIGMFILRRFISPLVTTRVKHSYGQKVVIQSSPFGNGQPRGGPSKFGAGTFQSQDKSESSKAGSEARPLHKADFSFDDVFDVWEYAPKVRKFIAWMFWYEKNQNLEDFILKNLSNLIEKAKSLTKREGGVEVSVQEDSNKYKFNAKDAIDLYVYMSQNGKDKRPFVILNQDARLIVGKLPDTGSYYCVPYADIDFKQQDKTYLYHSLNKLLYELIKAYNWKFFYFASSEDEIKSYSDASFRISKLNEFAANRFIRPKNEVTILRQDLEQSSTQEDQKKGPEQKIFADSVPQIYVQLNKLVKLDDWVKKVSEPTPTIKFIVLDQDKKVAMDPLNPIHKYTVTTWEKASAILSEEEKATVNSKMIKIAQQLVNLPHSFEVANWLRGKIRWVSEKDKQDVPNISGKFDEKLSENEKRMANAFNNLSVLNEWAANSLRTNYQEPKQQVLVNFGEYREGFEDRSKKVDQDNEVDKFVGDKFGPVKADYAVDIHRMMTKIVKDHEKFESAAVVDSSGRIVTGALEKDGRYRVISQLEAWYKREPKDVYEMNHPIDWYVKVHILTYEMVLRYL